MKLNRIYAIVLKNIYGFRHSYDKISDAFYWPTLDLVLWGITSSVVQATSGNISNFLLMVVSGVVFWIIFWRAQYEITIGVLDELWNKNLVNIFVTPLRFSEWVIAWLVMGILKGSMSFVFAFILAFVLYKTNFFVYGFYMLPFLLMLLFSGWWIGFMIASIIMRYGTKVQTLAWSLPWVLAPFSALYYPVTALPDWAEAIARMMPTSYVFEGMREVVATGNLDWNKVLISLLLNLFYLAIGVFLLHRSYRKLMEKGVVKLY
jgi:ABC-2 type transport system permease protein